MRLYPRSIADLARAMAQIAARVAAARAEGYAAGRAEVTAAVEALVHEDWCCAMGCAGYGFCEGCDGTEADCRCMKSIFRAALAAAPTSATVRADAGRLALLEMADEIDRGPTFPLPPSVISALIRERAEAIRGVISALIRERADAAQDAP